MSTIGVFIVTLFVLSACGGGTTGTSPTPTSQPQGPIKIGISVSLSGDFAADGKAVEQGYQLWAENVNKNGGILGRQVSLDFVSDASSTSQVNTNYQKLITVDHVDFVFGGFSTLLTKPASVVASRYGYAFLEGSGGGPSVFNRGLTNIFDVSPPVANGLISFARFILSLPPSQRPQTAAYATQNDPFTQPQVDNAKQLLEQGGVKTAYYTVYPAETTDFTPIAQKVIASGAQIVIGGTQLPDIVAFIQNFKQQHYNPQALIATTGPDQGDKFTKPIGGTQTAEGIFVTNEWWAQLNGFENQQMVQNYIAKFGGTADSMSADVAEAYSVGQVFEQAIKKIGKFDNAALIKELHSGDTFQCVEGSVQFDSTGQNTAGQLYLFQWQKGGLVPVYPTSVAKATPEFPKPKWP